MYPVFSADNTYHVKYRNIEMSINGFLLIFLLLYIQDKLRIRNLWRNLYVTYDVTVWRYVSSHVKRRSSYLTFNIHVFLILLEKEFFFAISTLRIQCWWQLPENSFRTRSPWKRSILWKVLSFIIGHWCEVVSVLHVRNMFCNQTSVMKSHFPRRNTFIWKQSKFIKVP